MLCPFGGILVGQFFLNISDNFFMACNLVASMDATGYVGAGLDISSIIFIYALVAAS